MASLPKISLSFRLIRSRVDSSALCEGMSLNKGDFVRLIPVKVARQVWRIQRDDAREHETNVSLKDGSTIRASALLNSPLFPEKKPQVVEAERGERDHLYRKLKIASSFHAELINFFASPHAPRVLSTDRALWTILKVGEDHQLTFSFTNCFRLP